MGIGKRILSVLIGILFIISVSVLGGSLLAKQVLVKAISQAGIDTAISHRMMDAVLAMQEQMIHSGLRRYRTRLRRTRKYRKLQKRSWMKW